MKQYLATAFCLMVFCGTAHGTESTYPLSLKGALLLAVERNLDIRAELYNPALAEAAMRGNRGIYDTRLLLSGGYQYSDIQPNSTITGGLLSQRQQKSFNYSVGANQLISTGASVGLNFNNIWSRNTYDGTSSLSNYSYWQSDLSLTVTQPLLKNFGRDTTDLNIVVARYGKEESLEQFKGRLLTTVAQVRNEYYKLYALREDLEVRRTSLALAQKILDETKARVKAGVMPAMEILNAEFGVASREKELIDADQAVSDQADVLRQLLQIKDTGVLVPVDAPGREQVAIDESEAMARALESRPEIMAQRVAVQSLEYQEKVARNRTRPDLNFTAGASLTGLAGDYDRDLEHVGSADYPVWNVGLTFDYPLGNSAAENDHIRSRLKVGQARTQVKNLEESICNEVKSAVRNVASSYKQLDVADRGRAFAEERLQAYIKKAQVGLATNKEVFEVENELVVAKTNQIRAMASYAIGLSQLWKATGELLERDGIVINDKDAMALYEGSK